MNWGYWGSTGIVASSDYQARMAEAGIGSIEPPEAMRALDSLMSGPLDQLAMVKTSTRASGEPAPAIFYASDAPSLIGELGAAAPPPVLHAADDSQSNGHGEPPTALRRLASQIIGVPEEQIEWEAELTDYGFDRLTFDALAQALNETFRLDKPGHALTHEVFVEHGTLRSLSDFLLSERRDALARLDACAARGPEVFAAEEQSPLVHR